MQCPLCEGKILNSSVKSRTPHIIPPRISPFRSDLDILDPHFRPVLSCVRIVFYTLKAGSLFVHLFINSLYGISGYLSRYSISIRKELTGPGFFIYRLRILFPVPLLLGMKASLFHQVGDMDLLEGGKKKC